MSHAVPSGMVQVWAGIQMVFLFSVFLEHSSEHHTRNTTTTQHIPTKVQCIYRSTEQKCDDAYCSQLHTCVCL